MSGGRPLLLVPVAALLGACAGYRPPTLPRLPPVSPGLDQRFAPEQESGEGRAVLAGARPDGGLPPSLAMLSVPEQDGVITLKDVLDSVERHFPDLAIARLEGAAAEGRVLASEGAFDTLLSIDSKNKLAGYYENNVLDAVLEQPIEHGGLTALGGYRFGLGDFGSYDGDIKTNSAGEVFLGLTVPLLKDSAIDERRAELFKARLRRDATDPLVHDVRVRLCRRASAIYWKTLAAAQKVQVARDLLALAQNRQESLQEAVRQGELPPIDAVDNDRLIADREHLLLTATRDFEEASIALSLYLRGASGDPVRARLEDLPLFPGVPQIASDALDEHVQYGLLYHPQLRLLGFEGVLADVEREKRENDLLPKLNVSGLASQDLGTSTDPASVDDPFEFEVGVKFELPLARRASRGRLAEARAKIAQLGHKVRLQADKVEIEIRDAASAYQRAVQRLAWTRRAAELAQQLEEAERDRLAEGDSDLLRVNLREQTTAKARSDVINDLALCFVALADYRAALGLPEMPPVYAARALSGE